MNTAIKTKICTSTFFTDILPNYVRIENYSFSFKKYIIDNNLIIWKLNTSDNNKIKYNMLKNINNEIEINNIKLKFYTVSENNLSPINDAIIFNEYKKNLEELDEDINKTLQILNENFNIKDTHFNINKTFNSSSRKKLYHSYFNDFTNNEELISDIKNRLLSLRSCIKYCYDHKNNITKDFIPKIILTNKKLLDNYSDDSLLI